MKLEILPVREREGPKRFSRRRDTVRVVWIVGEAPKATLSGGYMLGVSPI